MTQCVFGNEVYLVLSKSRMRKTSVPPHTLTMDSSLGQECIQMYVDTFNRKKKQISYILTTGPDVIEKLLMPEWCDYFYNLRPKNVLFPLYCSNFT